MFKKTIGFVSALCLAAGGEATPPPEAAQAKAENGALPVLISTDISNGLLDTHGAQGSCPVVYSATSLLHDHDFVPQDTDDGWAVALALNLEAEGLVNVEAVIPTFGNATLPAEMLVARQIVHNLKGRADIPIPSGAAAPAGQVLQPAPRWFDGSPVPIAGPKGSFAAACMNPGVELMRDRLMASPEPLTILALGPLTDIACLFLNAPQAVANIREVVALASQVAGKPLKINDLVVNDFNFRTDPLGGALFLDAAREVPIRLITFALSGRTSQKGDELIVFTPETLKGPSPPTPESERSLDWLLAAAQKRNAYWAGIFGVPEGPFDQYTLMAAIDPKLFDCREGLAYVQQCPYPAWSPAMPIGPSGPTEEPYNHEPNPCVDHGTKNGAVLASVPAQLVVTFDTSSPGPLVRGATGVAGNIPPLGKAREVTACVDFASREAFEKFRDVLYKHTW